MEIGTGKLLILGLVDFGIIRIPGNWWEPWEGKADVAGIAEQIGNLQVDTAGPFQDATQQAYPLYERGIQRSLYSRF